MSTTTVPTDTPEVDARTAEHVAAFDAQGNWFTRRDNLVTLTSWLAANGHSAKDIARAVEKPWDYEPEFRTAAAATEHERATGHQVWSKDNDHGVYCNEIDDCGWEFTPQDVPA